jgi:hypothetical protein
MFFLHEQFFICCFKFVTHLASRFAARRKVKRISAATELSDRERAKRRAPQQVSDGIGVHRGVSNGKNESANYVTSMEDVGIVIVALGMSNVNST